MQDDWHLLWASDHREALGGKTERSTKGWGIGLRESHVVDPEFESILDKYNNVSKKGSYTLIYDHHDQVLRLPKKCYSCQWQ